MKNQDIVRLEPLWGKWYVSEPLGRGKDYKVFSLYSKGVGGGDKRIVKWMRVEQSDIENDRERLNRVVSRLDLEKSLNSSDYIAGVEDFSVIENAKDSSWDVIVRMERYKTLSEHFDKNLIRFRDIVHIADSVVRALKECDANGVIHQDIKEANILVGEGGKFLLSDFSIAVKKGQEIEKSGSLAYISPEQYRGDTGTIKSDIYALGMMLYKMLNNGRIPFLPEYPESFTDDQYDAAIQARLSGERVKPLNTPIEKLNDLIEKMIAFHVDTRIDLFDIEEQLYQLIEDMDGNPALFEVQCMKGMLKDQMNELDQTVSLLSRAGNGIVTSIGTKVNSKAKAKTFINLDQVVVDYSKTKRSTAVSGKALKDSMSERMAEKMNAPEIKEEGSKKSKKKKTQKNLSKDKKKDLNFFGQFLKKLKTSKINTILEYGSYVCFGLVLVLGMIICVELVMG